jgi:hypothetical protein
VKYITVKWIGDDDIEGNEFFAIKLSNPTGGFELRDDEGLGTLIDDDSPSVSTPSVSVGDSSVPEGDEGSPKSMRFTVTLSSPVPVDVVVMVQVSKVTATRGTRLTGDWGGAINKKVVIRANTTSKVMVVPTFVDTNNELDLTVALLITSVNGADFGPKITGTGTILSDE